METAARGKRRSRKSTTRRRRERRRRRGIRRTRKRGERRRSDRRGRTRRTGERVRAKHIASAAYLTITRAAAWMFSMRARGHREAECTLPAKKRRVTCVDSRRTSRAIVLTVYVSTVSLPVTRVETVRTSASPVATRKSCVASGAGNPDTWSRIASIDSTRAISRRFTVTSAVRSTSACAPQDSQPPGRPSCCRYGAEGHLDLACAHSRRGFGGGGAPEFACFHCGERGHIARECPKSSRGPSAQPPVDFSRAPQTFAVGSGGASGGGVGEAAADEDTAVDRLPVHREDTPKSTADRGGDRRTPAPMARRRRPRRRLGWRAAATTAGRRTASTMVGKKQM